jgi:hypothetical protein
MMPRAILITVAVVGLGYGLLPVVSDEPRFDVETFGQPWTFESLMAELDQAGLHLQLEPFIKDERAFDEGYRHDIPAVQHQMVLADGENGVTVLVYESVEDRQMWWTDDGDGLSWDGSGVTIEVHEFIEENVVVLRGQTSRDQLLPPYEDLAEALRQASMGTE